MNLKGIFKKKQIKINNKKKLNIVISVLLVVLVVTIFTANIIYNMTHYVPEFYKISSNKISEKMRIVFISDLHLREYGKDNVNLINDIKSLSPDLILLGGDLVVEEKDNYDNMVSLCNKLSQISPTYGVWGNHEDIKMYIQKDTKLREKFEKSGAVFLTNEAKEIAVKENNITICGLDGSASNFEKYGAKDIMDKLNEMTGFKICLVHVPTYFTQKLTGYDFDLGLSGHTHGGIINIPKIGPLYSREEKFLPKYAQGQHKLKNNAELIISRGMGHSSIIPRINNAPELSVIDLE